MNTHTDIRAGTIIKMIPFDTISKIKLGAVNGQAKNNEVPFGDIAKIKFGIGKQEDRKVSKDIDTIINAKLGIKKGQVPALPKAVVPVAAVQPPEVQPAAPEPVVEEPPKAEVPPAQPEAPKEKPVVPSVAQEKVELPPISDAERNWRAVLDKVGTGELDISSDEYLVARQQHLDAKAQERKTRLEHS